MSESERPKAAQTKAERREEARLKALQLREETKRREKRNRVVAISVLIAAVVVLVGVVAFIMSQKETFDDVMYKGDTPPTLADSTGPSTAREDGAITVGAGGVAGTTATDPKAVEVVVVFDYECVWCGRFEMSNGPVLKSLTDTGAVTVAYRPISMMNQRAQFSTRAGNAAAVVADGAPDKFVAFSEALFAVQESEAFASPYGLKDSRIAEIAKEVGVPDDVVSRFTDTVAKGSTERTYSKWLVANYLAVQETAKANGKEQFGTPYILIDGVEFVGNFQNPGEFESAVLSAVAAKAAG